MPTEERQRRRAERRKKVAVRPRHGRPKNPTPSGRGKGTGERKAFPRRASSQRRSTPGGTSATGDALSREG
ncbi:hypothetical protein GRJ2_002432200 [Grus japonensis]|uniref:Uncharacterized protein n=1 Tax=Grus japonensis TaxID=30415 RepID=A0ABC9XPM2_GRUJA